jgi:cytochrome P450
MRNAASDAASLPALGIDPFSRDCLIDPYPAYQTMRASGPVFWLSRYSVYGVARHEDVRSVLTNWQTFGSSAGVGLSDYRKEKPWRRPGLLLEADPPVHTRTRAIITRVLSPAAARKLRADFEVEAHRLVDELIERGSFDAIKDLAEAYPLKVFPDAVGIPDSDRQNLLHYGNMVFNAFGPKNELFHAAFERADRYGAWIAQCCNREVLAPDSFGAQIYAAADAGDLTHEEAPRLVRTFLSAGLDTTVAGLGNAIYLFATHPEQWDLLREHPSLARAAFEETLRCESPFQALFRTTTEATEIAGQPIAAGEKIFVALASANRDPERWSEPYRFDITRRTTGHMAFGTGIHGCVGQVVARLEGELALTALARDVKRIEITGTPERRLNNTLRGLKSLPVTLHRAS